jgi:hypothetical protein
VSREWLIWLLLALWAGAMAASAFALAAESVGDGFLRGLDRVIGFFGWQLVAAVLALLVWIAGRPLPKGTVLRWLARVPGWWCVAMLVVFTGFAALSFGVGEAG